jgi:hypothetical protein
MCPNEFLSLLYPTRSSRYVEAINELISKGSTPLQGCLIGWMAFNKKKNKQSASRSTCGVINGIWKHGRRCSESDGPPALRTVVEKRPPLRQGRTESFQEFKLLPCLAVLLALSRLSSVEIKVKKNLLLVRKKTVSGWKTDV